MTGDTGTWILAGLMVTTALGIGVFWTIWLGQTHDQAWLPRGYVEHERAFMPADAVLAVLLVGAAILLLTEHPRGPALSLVCAGMLAFLGLLDAAYFWQNGLFSPERGGVGNAAVVVAVLTLAALLVRAFLLG